MCVRTSFSTRSRDSVASSLKVFKVCAESLAAFPPGNPGK